MNKIPDNYRCHKCNVSGHYISDCPENGNKYFDTCKIKGVPKEQVMMMLLKLNDEFKHKSGNVAKSLLKQNEIYSLDENDV